MPPGAAPRDQPTETTSVRLAELVATVSLVTDLGIGQPMEHVLRQTVIAMRLSRLAGYGEDDREAVYYASLLAWIGCAADTHDLAALFGDETELYTGAYDVDTAGAPFAAFLLRRLGSGRHPVRRAAIVGSFAATGGRPFRDAMRSHCVAASDLAERLGLGPDVRTPLLQAFERWDGRGNPGAVGAGDLAPVIRVVQLADTIEAYWRRHGPAAAADVARRHRGTRFDPDLVDCFCEHRDEVVDGLAEIVAWDEVISLAPTLDRCLDHEELDRALEALADFADLKSPFTIGHSRGVAALASDAASHLGLARDVSTVRRAALVHDVGVIGVPGGVWDEERPWSLAQRERARTHPYLTGRMLARSPELAAIGRCAALHHERLDGSGYPHGLGASAIPVPARLLAAADVYHALREPRPHRPPVDAVAAERTVREEVRAGRLDGEAVAAVLVAAGHRVRRRPALPGGLTRREVEVLVCLARGWSNPEIAAELGVARKTVSAHLEHAYAKLGVSTRTEAALFVMEHGLVDDPLGS